MRKSQMTSRACPERSEWVARRLRFQAAAGAHPVEVAIEIEPEQISRVVGRPSRLGHLRVAEAGLLQIELPDKSVKETDRALRRQINFQSLGQEQHLAPIRSSNVFNPGI